ncbi:MAG: 30S ribosomal protein S4 [Cryobacterium sp.]|nr:30S ribosomal protein S4 [Oligoflexia bacterium]
MANPIKSKSSKRKAFKTQRALNVELPGMGKPGALERRPYPPGQHGLRRRKFSEFSLRLQEKQKLRFHYGMREEQLRNFVKKAKYGRAADWMAVLVGHLETRVDNIVFRLGFAPSIPAARQLVRHGKVRVDGKRLDIASARVLPGSEVSLTDDAYSNVLYQTSISQPRLLLPDWLEHIPAGSGLRGRLKFTPGTDAVPFPFNGRLVVEFYTGV